jgi:superfamily II DNA or RNA helicase
VYLVEYNAFLTVKQQTSGNYGFEPVWMPTTLFPFQQALVEWSCRKGRAAIYADCGLGKTPMQLVWAENIARKTGGRVLVLTPLAVAPQTVREGEKFDVEVTHRREGIRRSDRIVVTNYERLHYFRPKDFSGVVCDESSILKNFSGEMRRRITDFMRTRPYRLLCTATAAPNDYVELGTSSEALGYLERKHMLAQFFTHDSGDTSSWVLKGHARSHLFWQWMFSWSRAVRRPSDLGFDDGAFRLPKLTVQQHVVASTVCKYEGFFQQPAIGLAAQRADLRQTIRERCNQAAELINAHRRPAIAWCNLNAEGDVLTELIDGAVQVAGSDSEEHKERSFAQFVNGDVRVLVTKPTIGGFGLNFQHCAHQTFFPSHSYEQYYQAVRRCWRFGQGRPVTVDVITTSGQKGVLHNLIRKSDQAANMFDKLSAMMRDELHVVRKNEYTKQEDIPSWL